MAGADYTDGGGWSKLDKRSAVKLAEVAAGFTRSTFNDRLKMLLVLYSTIGQSGTTRVSYRRLSELADVSESKAKRFIEHLVETGAMEVCETVKDDSGEYTVRRFSWTGGVSQKSDSPGVKKPRKNDSRCVKKPRKNDAHQSVQSTQNACTPCTHPGAGRLEPPARGPEGRPLTLVEQAMMHQPPNTHAFGGDADGR